MTTYIDVHIIQTVPPSNINRDDTGSPKSAVYGGVRRSRVSSQAWKRATRAEFSSHLDTAELGVRTKRVVEQMIGEIVARRPDLEESAEDLAAKVLKVVDINLAKEKKESSEKREVPQTEYLIFLSRAQISALAELAIDSVDSTPDKKSVKKAFHDDTSIDVALFGRMIANAPDLNVDACCQVAHAISVHPASNEFDYFTAVDDKAPEDNAGAGMIGTVEFVSSTMYRYATVNADALAASLGSIEAAAKAAEAFVRAFAVSMPTGKSNTFANRTRADLVLVQVRDDQPVNLVGAFESAIASTTGRTEQAVLRLAEHAADQDAAYGTLPVAGAFLAAGAAATETALEKLGEIGQRADLNGVVRLVGEQVRERVEEK
ncbi:MULTISPECIES: type I-E CRISPR-associated protein Cas7/Cse4/CasC [unclassified Dietzia]|uniref:type I-E CRISPR-associated protein Cas7/Cse4/CasC n=1 Tax=unclassified Dietzia TaxID=2617939 RepID=UPI0015FBA929|nr:MULTISPECIES: type I-E CRISPR-associated protein Cas7/Cse4/CasC [unclassified Dietzia]MBB1055766.1 type I-E CRISPR-associated protein Cas7/Cse4/CasC [Dietzia sp. B44]MBB1058814.1 type I-E CRISPR-associated protein Cas7/Cse4/CasC [Dietzia sp. B19]